MPRRSAGALRQRQDLGHILVAVSTLTAGVAAYTDLRHDVTDKIRINAVQAARLEALTERMNARDVADATLSARFGAVEELMRDMRNELREMRGPPLPANDLRRFGWAVTVVIGGHVLIVFGLLFTLAFGDISSVAGSFEGQLLPGAETVFWIWLVLAVGVTALLWWLNSRASGSR